jgi:hypothetical protein
MPPTMQSSWIIRRRKDRPGLITLHACCKSPISDSSSFRVHALHHHSLHQLSFDRRSVPPTGDYSRPTYDGTMPAMSPPPPPSATYQAATCSCPRTRGSKSLSALGEGQQSVPALMLGHCPAGHHFTPHWQDPFPATPGSAPPSRPRPKTAEDCWGL